MAVAAFSAFMKCDITLPVTGSPWGFEINPIPGRYAGTQPESPAFRISDERRGLEQLRRQFRAWLSGRIPAPDSVGINEMASRQFVDSSADITSPPKRFKPS